jgi:hypothetical protein
LGNCFNVEDDFIVDKIIEKGALKIIQNEINNWKNNEDVSIIKECGWTLLNLTTGRQKYTMLIYESFNFNKICQFARIRDKFISINYIAIINYLLLNCDDVGIINNILREEYNIIEILVENLYLENDHNVLYLILKDLFFIFMMSLERYNDNENIILSLFSKKGGFETVQKLSNHQFKEIEELANIIVDKFLNNSLYKNN